MNRYDLIHLAQLLFALGVMFAAFLAGLAVGRWRWGGAGRGPTEEHRVAAGGPYGVKADLFSRAGRPVSIDLTAAELTSATPRRTDDP